MRLSALSLLVFAGLTASVQAGHELTQLPSDPPPPSPGDVLNGDWGGARSALANRGIVPSLSYVGEVMGNTTGGFRRATIYEGLLTLGLDVDLQKLVNWQGAKFHIGGLVPHGAGLTQKALGDVGVVSFIDAYDGARLDTLWLEQSFGGNRFSLRVGVLALDDEFYQNTAEGLCVHAAYGWSSALGLNVPLPTYPYACLGARLKAQLSSWSYVMVGAFDGNPAPGVFHDPSPNAVSSTDFNKHGTAFSLRRDEGAFLLAEAGVHFNDPPDPNAPPVPQTDWKKAVKEPRGLFTSVKVGVGYDTDTFSDSYDATVIGLGSPTAPDRARARGGDWAVYTQVDQELFREPGSDSQGLSAFLHGTYMPPDRNAFDFSGEAGLVYTGLIPKRDDDQCGIGCALIHASAPSVAATRDSNRATDTNSAVSPYELAFEATYNAHLRPGVWLQPDLQFIVHPGATNAHGNALVIGLRTTINF
ncbi:MAG: carbohydrate porin [Chthoniobacter sp.]